MESRGESNSLTFYISVHFVSPSLFETLQWTTVMPWLVWSVPCLLPFLTGFTQSLWSSLTGLPSNPQMWGERANHYTTETPTNPQMDQFFCTSETSVFTLCSTSNFLLPHPPTAKISTNVTSSEAFLASIVTLIMTFCLSVSWITKSVHLCHVSLNVCISREKNVVFVIGLFHSWLVCRVISPAPNQHSAEPSDTFKAASWHKKF